MRGRGPLSLWGQPMADSHAIRYRPHDEGSPGPMEHHAFETATDVVHIADDPELTGDKAPYRHFLVMVELERRHRMNYFPSR